jgi:hypothetical protein
MSAALSLSKTGNFPLSFFPAELILPKSSCEVLLAVLLLCVTRRTPKKLKQIMQG